MVQLIFSTWIALLALESKTMRGTCSPGKSVMSRPAVREIPEARSVAGFGGTSPANNIEGRRRRNTAVNLWHSRLMHFRIHCSKMVSRNLLLRDQTKRRLPSIPRFLIFPRCNKFKVMCYPTCAYFGRVEIEPVVVPLIWFRLYVRLWGGRATSPPQHAPRKGQDEQGRTTRFRYLRCSQRSGVSFAIVDDLLAPSEATGGKRFTRARDIVRGVRTERCVDVEVESTRAVITDKPNGGVISIRRVARRAGGSGVLEPRVNGKFRAGASTCRDIEGGDCEGR